jgi:intracellular sulfur oxidation DsrE/DsrF family protein
MKHEQPLSEEYLNAFVDNELAAAERTQLVEQINNDSHLKQQVCELNMLKEMVRTGYRQTYEELVVNAAQRGGPYLRHVMAACCLIVVGVLAGWLGHGRYENNTADFDVVSLNNVVANSDNIVVHVDTASPVVFERALNQVEGILANARSEGRPVQLRLAANSNGLDLFRVSTSPFADRIRELQRNYTNLTLIGCGQSIRKLKERQQDVKLLPNVTVVPAVLDEVVQDLKNGWTYLKV